MSKFAVITTVLVLAAGSLAMAQGYGPGPWHRPGPPQWDGPGREPMTLMQAVPQQRRVAPAARQRLRQAARNMIRIFAALDVNGDGVIDRREFVTQAPKLRMMAAMRQSARAARPRAGRFGRQAWMRGPQQRLRKPQAWAQRPQRRFGPRAGAWMQQPRRRPFGPPQPLALQQPGPAAGRRVLQAQQLPPELLKALDRVLEQKVNQAVRRALAEHQRPRIRAEVPRKRPRIEREIRKPSPPKQPRPVRGAMIREHLKKFFKHHDRNGDGVVTPEEWPKQRMEMFKAIDANKDGRIDKTEAARFMGKMMMRKHRMRGKDGRNADEEQERPYRAHKRHHRRGCDEEGED